MRLWRFSNWPKIQWLSIVSEGKKKKKKGEGRVCSLTTKFFDRTKPYFGFKNSDAKWWRGNCDVDCGL